jgi:hypothetical protein
VLVANANNDTFLIAPLFNGIDRIQYRRLLAFLWYVELPFLVVSSIIVHIN